MLKAVEDRHNYIYYKPQFWADTAEEAVRGLYEKLIQLEVMPT